MLRAATGVGCTALVVAFGFAPPTVRPWILAGAALCAGLSLIRHGGSVVKSWCIFVAAMIGLKTLAPTCDVWPFHLAVPIIVVILYSRFAPGPSPLLSWASRGSFAAGIKVLTAIVVGVSALGFFSWLALAHPQMPAAIASARSPIVVLSAGAGFAAVNAVLEELAFRGLALSALSSVFRAKYVAVILQAMAFAALHYAAPSMPAGIAGAILTFVYGLALGFLAVEAEGILAPTAAHFVADLFVFFAMAGFVP